MDQMETPANIEESNATQMDNTVDETEAESNGFVGAESTLIVTFDKSTSNSAFECDKDKPENITHIEDKNENENESSNTETPTAFDLSTTMETSALPSENISRMESETELENSTTIAEEYDHHKEESYFKCKLLELGRYLFPTDSEKQCYTKGCLWSPDGTCCLLPVHMDGMHLIELPTDLYQEKVPPYRPITKLSSAVHVKEGGTVYDCAWYPFMNSVAPETCCWLASRQHEPIQMWDAFNGDLRATYRGYDDVDEIEAAISVAFSNDGEYVLGGYKKCIRIFNTEVPGRDSARIITKQAISCFALNTNSSDIITTGSWNGVISLYDQRISNIGSLSSIFGHVGGITFLKYSNNGDILFSGARKDSNLCVWDMRNFSEPVTIVHRSVATNQRIYFDLSPQNEWLISGDTEGLLRVWNLNNMTEGHTYRVHSDSCNGVNFHPNKPIIATSAGQYHFVNAENESDSQQLVVDYENSLIFWWIEPRS